MAKQIESKHTDTVALIGRLLIAVLFLMSGLSKLTQPGATIGYIAAVGLPLPTISYFVSMTVELIGSVLLIVSRPCEGMTDVRPRSALASTIATSTLKQRALLAVVVS